jgi:predicted CoA-substrate-specific enzyme activase
LPRALAKGEFYGVEEGIKMLYKAGLDIGSVMAKAVIMNDNVILSYSIRPVSGSFQNAANGVLKEALDKAGLTLDKLNIVAATGLGASFLDHPHFEYTDVTCQSRGMNFLFPAARIVIEVGDQSSRVIKLTEKGRVADCAINDRCAAGSGRILQIMSKVLRVNIDELGNLSVKSTNPVRFSTGCSVFLETEVISRIAEGTKKGDIIAGLHQAMAIKILSMIQKVKMEEICAITGGGAKDLGLVKMIGEKIGRDLLIPEEPFITGALGAALMATEKIGIQNA